MKVSKRSGRMTVIQVTVKTTQVGRNWQLARSSTTELWITSWFLTLGTTWALLSCKDRQRPHRIWWRLNRGSLAFPCFPTYPITPNLLFSFFDHYQVPPDLTISFDLFVSLYRPEAYLTSFKPKSKAGLVGVFLPPARLKWKRQMWPHPPANGCDDSEIWPTLVQKSEIGWKSVCSNDDLHSSESPADISWLFLVATCGMCSSLSLKLCTSFGEKGQKCLTLDKLQETKLFNYQRAVSQESQQYQMIIFIHPHIWNGQGRYSFQKNILKGFVT